jgi:hypothetical protein
MSLARYVKEGRFSVLRKYVPEAIFQDTNLPYVKVIVKKEKATVIEPEHPELALSLLIPARVMFRYHPGGHILPILQSSHGPIATELAKNYKIVPCEYTPSRYMEEYEYVLKELNLDRKVRCFLLSEVVLEKSNLFRERDFPMELGCHGYAPRGRYIYRFPLEEPLRNVWQITSKTIAYPRLGAAFSYETSNKWCDELLGLILNYRQLTHVIKYMYGEDIRIHYRYLSSASLSDLKNNTLRVKRGIIEETRLFENDNTPCILGYEVKGTWGLEIETYPWDLLDKRLKKFIDNFVDCNDNPESCLQEPLKFYTTSTVCQTLVNMLLYVLTKDLYTCLSTTQNNSFQYLAELAEVALLYSELQLNRSICEVLAMPIDEALERLKVRLRGAFEELKRAYDRESRCYNMGLLVLVAIFKGQRARELLRRVSNVDDTSIDDYINIVIKRFKDLIEKLSGRQYEDEKEHYWNLGVLKYVFIHTLNHHILKNVALSSRLTPEYLKEGLNVYGGGASALVYENVSGGIRAIEQALRAWGFLNRKEVIMDQEKIEKLLLQLGECSLGSAEDLLYLEYIMPKKPESIGLIYTPWELEEYYKVKFNFKEEVSKLSEFWDLDPIKLEENIVELLKHTDIKLARFSNYEQLISFYLKNIGMWGVLDELIKKAATASFEARKLSIDIDSLLRKLKASLMGFECIEEKDERVEEIMKQIRILLNTVRPIFLRLIPRSCNPSCAMCYFNRTSCIYGDPYTQIYMLNRRLLKLYASYIVEAMKNKCSEECLALVRLNEEDVCVCL